MGAHSDTNGHTSARDSNTSWLLLLSQTSLFSRWREGLHIRPKLPANWAQLPRAELRAPPAFDSDWPPSDGRGKKKEKGVEEERCGSTRGELANYHFKRSALKRLPLWTKCLHPYIKGEAWLTWCSRKKETLRRNVRKSVKKCWDLNSPSEATDTWIVVCATTRAGGVVDGVP